jgi:hypothetical protein
MLLETVALEALRQKIEAALQQSGSLADYLDRGQPDAAAAVDAERQIAELESFAASCRQQLEQACAHYPEAVQEWAALHIEALRKIQAEPPGQPNAAARRMVAANTIQEWERVRAGQQTYVGTNWYFLADYQEAMRRLLFVLPC